MRLALPKKRETSSVGKESLSKRYATLLSWLFTWEIYLIVAVAAFLRLYGINTTEFDDDQANVFRMAHDAVSHGLLVATSNVASIHIYNPPAIIYFFMLPAAMSADPLWGAVMVGLLMTVSVLLTYILARRYFGRVAGIIAALLYATASRPIFYSRFIWNQNLLPIFTILFIFALFWGVVERRKGWLFPALFLLGVLIQLHASGVMMAAPLLVALILAPGTLRWRDLAFGILSLIVIYFPYLLWEISMNFIDVHTLLTVTKQPIFVDNKAWIFYQLFLSPYDYDNLPGRHTLLAPLVPALSWMRGVMTGLVIGGTITAFVFALWVRRHIVQGDEQKSVTTGMWRRIRDYATQFRASPYRCGLIILLIWQVVPLLVLTRHSIGLYAHYLIIFMPGPFILISLLLTKIIEWCQRRGGWTTVVRYDLYILAFVLVTAQFVGSTASVLDSVLGNFNDYVPSHPYYSDLHSLHAALAEADQVAQQHHLNRVYVSTDQPTQASLRYLSEQMHTSTTVFDAANCAILPGVANGPAVMLIGPYSDFTNALVTHFAVATLVDEPKRLGGAPFKLYIVRPTELQSVAGERFGHDLQLLDTSAHSFSFNGTLRLVTRWSLLRSAQPSYRTVYGYNISQSSDGADKQSASSQCNFTAMKAGDELLVASRQPGALKEAQGTIAIRVQAYTITPYNLSYGPISFETYHDIVTPWEKLSTSTGKDNLTIPVSRS